MCYIILFQGFGSLGVGGGAGLNRHVEWFQWFEWFAGGGGGVGGGFVTRERYLV